MGIKFSCLLISVSLIGASCHNYQENKSHQNVADASIEKGEGLAKQYCQSCHQLPDPSMLSSAVWEKGVLPQMGPRLGIFAYGFNMYPSKAGDHNIGRSFYPSQPVMSLLDWQYIIDYYTSLSPDTLISSAKDEKITESNSLFIPVATNSLFSYPAPVAGCVHVDTTSDNHSLLVSDLSILQVLSASNNGATDSLLCSSPVSSLVLQHDTLTTANIGTLNPNDAQTGTIQQAHYQNGKFISQPVRLDSGLRRPVHIDVADLNRDGKTDILICEFGNLKGSLSWLENKGSNRYEYHIIKNQPGAIATVIKDFNKDGLPDFYVLFAQGDEQVVRFQNKGNGSFEAETLLHFPPVYGSSYFEMNDIDNDGDNDIIYTCGDNADYSVELKPYHGVYIFTNDGNDHFTRRYFFHLNGCFKAMAKDFDGDGDADIAAISFFADYKNRPEEGFVYLKNNGSFHFAPYSVPAAKDGRWISMDIADINKDGKPDILLGNFSYPSFIPSPVDWTRKPAILVLKNNTF